MENLTVVTDGTDRQVKDHSKKKKKRSDSLEADTDPKSKKANESDVYTCLQHLVRLLISEFGATEVTQCSRHGKSLLPCGFVYPNLDISDYAKAPSLQIPRFSDVAWVAKILEREGFDKVSLSSFAKNPNMSFLVFCV